jgi:signal transduction histidine kinase
MTPQTLTSQELDQLINSSAASEWQTPASDSSLLQQLADIDRSLLSQLVSEQDCASGELVFREGENGDALYVIWSGKVAIVKGSLHAPTVLGYRGPGEAIGEMALLEDQPRMASAVALSSLRLLKISRESFRRLLDVAPAIGVRIMTLLSSRLRASDTVRAEAVISGKALVQHVSELRAERQQLLELDRVRQETSDLIIHDLRNPLGIIYCGISVLRMVLPENTLAENRDVVEMIDSAAQRMQRLVDSLLDVSKMESGEAQLKLAQVNLPQTAEEIAKRMALSLKSNDITLHVSLPEDLPRVTADAEKIDRVISNLVDNAVKYTPAGGQIILAAESKGDCIAVSITDTGPGIPPQERERIFERFAQVADDQPRRRGFGLGLTFCKLTVEAHGGRIWVEPGEGGAGSRFVFTLPLS